MLFRKQVQEALPGNPFVERGVALLDRLSPDWYKHIDLGVLSLRSNTRCVLGQLAEKDPVIIAKIRHGYVEQSLKWGAPAPFSSHYDFGDFDHLAMVGHIEGVPSRRYGWSARAHGFMPTSGERPTEAWTKAIKERLAKDEAQAKAAKHLRVLEPDQERLEAILASYELVA